MYMKHNNEDLRVGSRVFTTSDEYLLEGNQRTGVVTEILRKEGAKTLYIVDLDNYSEMYGKLAFYDGEIHVHTEY